MAQGNTGGECSIPVFDLRQRTERDLVRSRAELQCILESTADGILAVDSNGKVIHSNGHFAEMWHLSRELVASGDDHALLAAVLEQLVSPETFLSKVKQLYNSDANDMDNLLFKDGRVFERYSSPLMLEGAVAGRVWSFRDITDYRRAEAALRESEERFRKIIEQSPIAMAIVSMSGVIEFINQKAINVFGYLPEDIPDMDRWWTQAYPDETYRQTVMADWMGRVGRAVTEGREIEGNEYRVSCKDRTEKIMFISGVPVADRIFVLFDDITERRQAEEALRRSHERYRELVELAVDGILLGDHEGFITGANSCFCMMTGQRHEELIGKHISSILFTRESLEKNPLRFDLVRRGETVVNERTIRRPDGVEVEIEMRSKMMPDGSYQSIYRDVTKRKQAEKCEIELRARLERAARLESLGVLAGGVAHDLNNILGPSVALPDLVIDYIECHGDPSDPETVEALETMRIIKSSARRAVGVVGDLVVMGRRGQFMQTQVNVNKVVSQVLESKQTLDLRAARPHVEVSRVLSTAPLWCKGSDSRLSRVLANLVGNAVEATVGQGTVTIRTGRRVFAESFQGYEVVPAGDYVTLEVADTGCGMEPATLARMFEPFFSTKAPGERSGSGLGLSVVHGLVKDHAGFIDVKSAPGAGTTFLVYLPAIEPVDPPKASAKVPLAGGRERVLVVDDDPDQLFLARRELKAFGYDVTGVSSGEKAVALFQAALQAGKPSPFDLVITDMIMKGLDGLATWKAIVDLYPRQKMMIVSGYAPDGYEGQLKVLGAAWLCKPYTDVDMAQAVRRRLDRE